MRDLEFPLLTSRIVSGLTGLSPQALRRWEARGIPSESRRRRVGRLSVRLARGGPRLYSWQDVEQLQRATYLVETGRVPAAEVRRLLERTAGAVAETEWVISRPKPRTRKSGTGRATVGGGAGRFPSARRRRIR